MGFKRARLPPNGIPTPEDVRKLRRSHARGRKEASYRRMALLKNASRAEKVQNFKKRPQSASARSLRVKAVNKAMKGFLSALLEDNEDTKNSPAPIRSPNMPDLDLEHVQGDVISLATDHSVIVHACNCVGAWGSGIALQLRSAFPAAYAIYAAHCKASTPTDLLGTCLLIAPQPDDNDAKPVWIACLFTSAGYGRANRLQGNPGRSHQRDIVTATGRALIGFLSEWKAARARADEKDKESAGDGDEGEREDLSPDSAIFCPKFNAGSFRVNWKTTEDQIVQIWKGAAAKWIVVSP